MSTINIRMVACVIFTLMLVTAALAQQPETTPTPPASEPQYVQEKGFKTKIIEVKYRDPRSLYSVISNLGSGVRGAVINPNSDFKTLTVRDFPENIAVIEEAVKRLDTPESVRPDIELHVHILIASNSPIASNEHPSELNDVIKQLQATLAYKNYSLMASVIQHAKESGRISENSGVAEPKLFNVDIPPGNPIFYQYRLDSISVRADAGGQTQIVIPNFNFSMRIPLNVNDAEHPKIQYQNVGFSTPVTVREGEKVVVGTTTMGDKGLIVVLSARVLSAK